MKRIANLFPLQPFAPKPLFYSDSLETSTQEDDLPPYSRP